MHETVGAGVTALLRKPAGTVDKSRQGQSGVEGQSIETLPPTKPAAALTWVHDCPAEAEAISPNSC